MVRAADYVYGIVPGRGEYGFESQPKHIDPTVLARVESLASSFQWTGLSKNDSVAIAVDCAAPAIVVRFATDPRDPEGRLSFCMQVRIVGYKESTTDIMNEVWPNSIFLPISKEAFLAEGEKQPSGRIIVGPSESFTAVGFEAAWGQHKAKLVGPLTGRSAARSQSSMANRLAPAQKQSKVHWKRITIVAFAPFFITTCIAVYQHWEIEGLKMSERNSLLSKHDVEKENARLQEQVVKVKKDHQQEAKDLADRTREVTLLKSRMSVLETANTADPDKVKQAELLELRRMKRTVEAVIQQLQDALPKSTANYEE